MPPLMREVWSAADLARAEDPGAAEAAAAQLVLRRVEVRGLADALAPGDIPFVVVRQGGYELAVSDARLDSHALHMSVALRAPLAVPPTGSGATMRLPEADDPRRSSCSCGGAASPTTRCSRRWRWAST